MTLESRLTAISGVGPAREAQFERLGLSTVKDLLWWFPRHYIDCRQAVYIADAAVDELVVIKGRVTDVTTSRSRRGQAVIRATITDTSGELSAIWFGQPFMADALQRPGERLFIGKIKLDRSSRRPTLMSATLLTSTGIIPIYSVTKGLTSTVIVRLLGTAVAALKRGELAEPYPKEFLKRLDLPERKKALRWIHRPTNLEQIKGARRRFAFDKLVDL